MDALLLKNLIFSCVGKIYNYSPTLLFVVIFAIAFMIVILIGEFVVFRSPEHNIFLPRFEEQSKTNGPYGLHRNTFFKRKLFKDKKKRMSVFKKEAIEMIKEDVLQNKTQNLVKLTPTISPSYCSLFRQRRRLRDSLDENKENLKCMTPKKKNERGDTKEWPSTYVLRNRRINF